MFTLRGTELALGSVSKAKEKGNESHENQFITVGNPASSNPDNSLDSHFSSRFGISSFLERHRMVSSSTPRCMARTDSESLTRPLCHIYAYRDCVAIDGGTQEKKSL